MPLLSDLTSGGRVHTAAGLEDRVAAQADRLRRLGVGEGVPVAVLAGSDDRLFVLCHALWRLRAVFVPLNLRWTAAEIRQTLDRFPAAFVLDNRNLPDERWEIAEGQGAAEKAPELDGIQIVLFTSGTTGFPKAALIPFSSIEASAAMSQSVLGHGPSGCWLCPLPLYHIGGLSILFRAAFDGSPVILQEKFDAGAVNRLIDSGEVSYLSLVPVMLDRLLETRAGRPLPESLRFILLGGAKAPPSLLRRARELRAPLAVTYGLTEAASQVMTLPPERFSRLPDAALEDLALAPLPGSRVSIVDETCTPVQDGEPGEIVVEGPQLMRGYWKNPEATAAAIRGGRLHTGDIGIRFPQGIVVTDRRSDLIVTGGENVYPAEIEAVLHEHPEVREAAVVGTADDRWGQMVTAVIVAAPGCKPSALERFCRERLAGYKVPRRWIPVNELPRTASGKVKRAELRELVSRREQAA